MSKALLEAEAEQGRREADRESSSGMDYGQAFSLSVISPHFLIGIGYLLLINILFDKQLLHVEKRNPLVAQEGPV